MVDRILDDAELARWTAWTSASDAVWEAIAHETGAAAGLTRSDFAILTRVMESGDGSLRQHDLATQLGWGRSRVSRQISRMVSHGLLVRAVDGAARMITATDAGRTAVAAARPAHAAAVRRALLDRVPDSAADQFWAVITAIAQR